MVESGGFQSPICIRVFCWWRKRSLALWLLVQSMLFPFSEMVARYVKILFFWGSSTPIFRNTWLEILNPMTGLSYISYIFSIFVHISYIYIYPIYILYISYIYPIYIYILYMFADRDPIFASPKWSVRFFGVLMGSVRLRWRRVRRLLGVLLRHALRIKSVQKHLEMANKKQHGWYIYLFIQMMMMMMIDDDWWWYMMMYIYIYIWGKLYQFTKLKCKAISSSYVLRPATSIHIYGVLTTSNG